MVAPSLVHRSRDGLRRLRRLWSPASVLLCFALTGLITPGIARLLEMIPPLSQAWAAGHRVIWWLLVIFAVVFAVAVNYYSTHRHAVVYGARLRWTQEPL